MIVINDFSYLAGCSYYPYTKLEACEILEKCKTRDDLIKAIENNGCLIEHIDQDEELCLIAVRQSYYAIHYVKEKTERLCYEALTMRDSFDLEGEDELYDEIVYHPLLSIENPTEDMCFYAIRNYYKSIRYIDNLTEEMCWEALKINVDSIHYILGTEEMIMYAADNDFNRVIDWSLVDNMTIDLCYYVIERNVNSYSHLPIRTIEMTEYAVKKNPKLLHFVPENHQSQELIDSIIYDNPNLFYYVPCKFHTEEMLEFMMDKNATLVLHSPFVTRDMIFGILCNPQNHHFKIPQGLLDDEMISVILEIAPYNLAFMRSSDITYDLAKKLIKINGIMFSFARQYKDLIPMALKNNPWVYKFLDYKKYENCVPDHVKRICMNRKATIEDVKNDIWAALFYKPIEKWMLEKEPFLRAFVF